MKKQRIPFDVSHNFVLLTIMKYKTTGERGGADKISGVGCNIIKKSGSSVASKEALEKV